MPIEWKGKIFPAGDSFRVTIPKPIIRTLKLKAGDTVTIWLDDHQIIIARKAT